MTGRLKRTYFRYRIQCTHQLHLGAGDLRRRFAFGEILKIQAIRLFSRPESWRALKAIGILHPTPFDAMSWQSQRTQAKAVEIWEGDKPYVLTSAEELFKRI